MQSSHAGCAVDIAFDDPNLVADAGLVSVVALAERVGLPELIDEQVRITGADNSAGANPAAKVMSLVAGMVAGADSIEDTDRLRHAGNAVVFDQIRAPSTLGTFLRAFTTATSSSSTRCRPPRRTHSRHCDLTSQPQNVPLSSPTPSPR